MSARINKFVKESVGLRIVLIWVNLMTIVFSLGAIAYYEPHGLKLYVLLGTSILPALSAAINYLYLSKVLHWGLNDHPALQSRPDPQQ